MIFVSNVKSGSRMELKLSVISDINVFEKIPAHSESKEAIPEKRRRLPLLTESISA